MSRAEAASQIRIRERVGNLLMLRSSVGPIFHKIAQLDETEVVVDFSGVEFMSRSFADEYRSAKAKSRKHIVERNVPVNVARMFTLVADQVRSRRSQVQVSRRSDREPRALTL